MKNSTWLSVLTRNNYATSNSVDLRPTAPSATIAAIRPPKSRLAQIVVKKDGTGDFATISEAINKAKTLQSVPLNPAQRVDIIVYPGTYTELVGLPDWINVYGIGKPLLTWTITDSSHGSDMGTLTTQGNMYWEGIDIHLTHQYVSWPKYPIHHSAYGTSIFANMSLEHYGLNPTEAAFGADSYPNSSTLLHNVNVAVGGWNCHGWQTNNAPLTYVFDHVTSQENLSYSDLGSGMADIVSVQNCTFPGKSLAGANLVKDKVFDLATEYQGGLSSLDRNRYGY